MWWMVWASAAASTTCDTAVVDGRIPTAEGALAFASRSADLVAEAEPAVAAVACLLGVDLSLTVQVEVHTDSRGSGSYNLRISQERADAVRAALIAAGADGSRVTANGYGELYPLDSNQAAGGRGTNRRIELHTTPSAERPPRPAAPEPIAQPAPSPEPDEAVDVCAEARGLRHDRVPTWRDARCSADGERWVCTVFLPFETLADEMAGCFDGVKRDGDELWLQLHGASFRMKAVADGTVITPG